MHSRREIGGSRSTYLFEPSSKAFDVVAGDIEQCQLSLLAPRRKLAQIQAVGIAGQSRVSAQEAEQRLLLRSALKTPSGRRSSDKVGVIICGFLSRRQEPEHRHGLEPPHRLSPRTYASLHHQSANSDSTERAPSGHSALLAPGAELGRSSVANVSFDRGDFKPDEREQNKRVEFARRWMSGSGET